MPALLTTWGCIVTLQGINFGFDMMTLANKGIGFVTSFGGLVTMRVLLGLVEGPMAPCIVCYLSGFYTRKELALRFVRSILSGCLFSIICLKELLYFFQPHRCVLRVSCQTVLIPSEFRSFLARSRVC